MKPQGPSKERVGERELSSQKCLKGSLSIKAKTRQTESRSTVWRKGEPGVEDAGQWKGSRFPSRGCVMGPAEPRFSTEYPATSTAAMGIIMLEAFPTSLIYILMCTSPS